MNKGDDKGDSKVPVIHDPIHWSSPRVAVFFRKESADDPTRYRMIPASFEDKRRALSHWLRECTLPQGFSWTQFCVVDGSFAAILKDVPRESEHVPVHGMSVECYYSTPGSTDNPKRVYNARERARWAQHLSSPHSVESVRGYQPWGFRVDWEGINNTEGTMAAKLKAARL